MLAHGLAPDDVGRLDGRDRRPVADCRPSVRLRPMSDVAESRDHNKTVIINRDRDRDADRDKTVTINRDRDRDRRPGVVIDHD